MPKTKLTPAELRAYRRLASAACEVQRIEKRKKESKKAEHRREVSRE